MYNRTLSRQIVEEYITWRNQGISNPRIAEVLGINVNTLLKWIQEGNELLKELGDEETPVSLFDDEIMASTIENLKMKLAVENRRGIARRKARSEAKALETGDIKHLHIASFLEKIETNDTKNLCDHITQLADDQPLKQLEAENNSQPILEIDSLDTAEKKRAFLNE